MEIILLDNGLRGRGEHSYHLIGEVREALVRRAIAYRVFGAKDLDRAIAAAFGAAPHFSDGLYNGRLPPPREWIMQVSAIFRALRARAPLYSEQRTWRLLNARYEADLAALPGDVWDRDKIIVVPAISQNQIFGLIRHLSLLPRDALPNVVAQLMFTPNWTPWGVNGALGEAYYREAFRLAKDMIGRTLFFTAENEAMADVYRRGFGIDVTILPIPFRGSARRTAGQNIRFGFFGYSKTEKGFHLLPQAIAQCQAKNLPVEFVVQIQHGHWEKETIETEKQLQSMRGVTLIEGVMTSAEYERETNAVDVTLLPYDPVRFGPRGSGLFTEAVAAGRPIIAARGIYAAAEIDRGGAEGEVFSPYTSAALADAIDRLLPRLPECRARAARHADAFARQHTGDAYVGALLRFANTES